MKFRGSFLPCLESFIVSLLISIMPLSTISLRVLSYVVLILGEGK
jgi:hypothetical protein